VFDLSAKMKLDVPLIAQGKGQTRKAALALNKCSSQQHQYVERLQKKGYAARCVSECAQLPSRQQRLPSVPFLVTCRLQIPRTWRRDEEIKCAVTVS